MENCSDITDIRPQIAVKLDCHKAVLFLTFSFVENYSKRHWRDIIVDHSPENKPGPVGAAYSIPPPDDVAPNGALPFKIVNLQRFQPYGL
jgi:hypothetical protein